MFEVRMFGDARAREEHDFHQNLQADERQHEQEFIAHVPEVREVHAVVENPAPNPPRLIGEQQNREQVARHVRGYRRVA